MNVCKGEKFESAHEQKGARVIFEVASFSEKSLPHTCVFLVRGCPFPLAMYLMSPTHNVQIPSRSIETVHGILRPSRCTESLFFGVQAFQETGPQASPHDHPAQGNSGVKSSGFRGGGGGVWEDGETVTASTSQHEEHVSCNSRSSSTANAKYPNNMLMRLSHDGMQKDHHPRLDLTSALLYPATEGSRGDSLEERCRSQQQGDAPVSWRATQREIPVRWLFSVVQPLETSCHIRSYSSCLCVHMYR